MVTKSKLLEMNFLEANPIDLTFTAVAVFKKSKIQNKTMFGGDINADIFQPENQLFCGQT